MAAVGQVWGQAGEAEVTLQGWHGRGCSVIKSSDAVTEPGGCR